ncbi:MAG: hypothetical protein HYS27_17305 [Deltaproteobacteria bacterium]|nr:hypothetical protein [Deltaproteobacteria bacterium]
MAQAYKRRLIPIVDRQFQFKYTGIIVGIAAAISLVLGYFLWKSYMEMNEVIDLASLSPEVNDKLNSDDARFVFTITLAFLAVEVAVLGVMGLLITHRVCGPIFVLQRHMESISSGNYPTMRPLRAGDEFRDAFDSFGKMIDTLRKRDDDEVGRLKAVLDAAKKAGVPAAEQSTLEKLIAEREGRVAGGAPKAG